jgi:hypothetical protein
MCCWILFSSILLRIFASYVHEGNWSVIFFFAMSFSGFGIWVIPASWNAFGSFPFYFMD